MTPAKRATIRLSLVLWHRSCEHPAKRRAVSRRKLGTVSVAGQITQGGLMMIEIGYTLSSEEMGPRELVRNARRAEECGFGFAMISDHYHPWIDRQGQSPYAWTVIGAVAQATERLKIGTGVTCPIMRYHPTIVAQAAATAASLAPGRFWLGLGTGENLNEHILGEHWPSAHVRREMLEEAIEVIRRLWKGEWTNFYGNFFTVENARIYTLPDTLPPILMAASGPESAEFAGLVADGLIGTAPDAELIRVFEEAGGKGKPRVGQTSVCWAASEEEARRTAFELWPTSGLGDDLGWELRLPRQFERAAKMVREEDVAKAIACGPDPERHIDQIRKFVDAGYTHVYVHQVGQDQEGFFQFYQREVLPKVRQMGGAQQRRAA